MNQPDVNKRLKGLKIPIDVCVKYERMAGFECPSSEITKKQMEEVGKLMVKALAVGCVDVVLTSKDFEQISEEVKRNEEKRNGSK